MGRIPSQTPPDALSDGMHPGRIGPDAKITVLRRRGGQIVQNATKRAQMCGFSPVRGPAMGRIPSQPAPDAQRDARITVDRKSVV